MTEQERESHVIKCLERVYPHWKITSLQGTPLDRYKHIDIFIEREGRERLEVDLKCTTKDYITLTLEREYTSGFKPDWWCKNQYFFHQLWYVMKNGDVYVLRQDTRDELINELKKNLRFHKAQLERNSFDKNQWVGGIREPYLINRYFYKLKKNILPENYSDMWTPKPKEFNVRDLEEYFNSRCTPRVS